MPQSLVICALIAIISAFSGPLLSLYLSYKFKLNTKDASSIGIIGGASGPTVSFLSGKTSTYWFSAIFTLLTILGIILSLWLKRSFDRR